MGAHSGEEHGEDVDGGLQQVVAADGDGHRGNEHQVTQAQQQGGEELEAVRVRLRIICAAPAVPAWERENTLSRCTHTHTHTHIPGFSGVRGNSWWAWPKSAVDSDGSRHASPSSSLTL